MKIRPTSHTSKVNNTKPTTKTTNSKKPQSKDTFEKASNVGKQIIKQGRPLYQLYKYGQAFALGLGVTSSGAASAVAAPLVGSLESILYLNSGVVELEGKVSSAMSDLVDKMQSKDPVVRKAAKHQASTFLKQAMKLGTKKPKLKEALLGWYGKFIVASDKQNKYKSLYKQLPSEMKSIHKSWYLNHSWIGRMLVSKTVPKG